MTKYLFAAVLAACSSSDPAPPKASVLDALAIDGDTTFLLWHTHYDMRPRGWLSRVDGTGRTRWWHELSAVPLHGATLHAGDGVIAIRYAQRVGRKDTDHALVAFSFSGKQLWDRSIAKLPPDVELATADPGVTGVFVAGKLVEWVNATRELIVLDARTGRTTTQVPTEQWVRWIKVIGTRVIVDNGPLLAIEVTTGQSTRLETNGAGCVVGSDYITITEDDQFQPRIVALANGDVASSRTIKESFAPFDRKERLELESCGSFGDRFVLAVDHARHGPRVVITDGTGDTLHTISFAPDDGLAWPSFPSPGASTELTRFTPYAHLSSQHGARLVMLDLQDGKLAWDRPIPTDGLFRAGTVWLASSVTGAGKALFAFDGMSGRAIGEYRSGIDHLIKPSARQVAGGKLWLVDEEETRVDAPNLAIIDTATMKPLLERGVKLPRGK